jgi:hypothetical protein
MAFIDSLKARPELSFGSIGKTNEGRDIPYVIASRPRVETPEQAKQLRRPVVYVQGNIHAGEVEGKEALLAMLRDLTSSPSPNVLDSIVLIAVPIYNADGNERFARQEVNRGSQNGPEMVGVRVNAQNLDLNRDYMKLEAPETRASVGMFNKWNPDVFVDLHTTNGSYHGYALTYAAPLNPAAPLRDYARDSILPVLRARMQSRHRFPTFDYGDFIADDTLSKGWITFDSRPRFGTNYYGLRGGIAILSEAYSHDPFEKRVKATYAFTREILSLVAERPQDVTHLTAMARSVPSPVIQDWENPVVRAYEAQTADLRSQPPVRATLKPRADAVEVLAEIVEQTGDSTRTEPGVPRGRRRTGRYVTVRMPIFDNFEPSLRVSMPRSYVLRESDTAVVGVLRSHGITVDTVKQADATELDGSAFVIDSAAVSPRTFQGHREMRVVGKWQTQRVQVKPGAYIVDTFQPLGVLAVYLLEPQSDDGLVTWNYFDADLKPGSTYPVFRIGGVPPSQ